MVKLLLKAKADVNVRDNVGMTALHWAGHNGYEAVVELLLEAEADFNWGITLEGQRCTRQLQEVTRRWSSCC